MHELVDFYFSFALSFFGDPSTQRKAHTWVRLDGSMNVRDRQEAIDKFQTPDGPFCFLLSTLAGGLGLTLVEADRVVVGMDCMPHMAIFPLFLSTSFFKLFSLCFYSVDPSWNPAVDNQAVDRAFRIGQQRNVVIYRLISCGTVEEKIYRKQVFKEALMKTTSERKQQFRYFSRQDLRELFRFDDPYKSETQTLLSTLHNGDRCTDDELESHICDIQNMGMCRTLPGNLTIFVSLPLLVD